MTLYEICLEIAGIENGLAYGEIQFNYDNLMCAMKPGHPADILDDIFSEIGNELYLNENAEIAIEKVEVMYTELKEFRTAFQVRQLDYVLKDLEKYIKVHKAEA